MKKFARKLAALAVLSLCATSASAILIAAPGGTIDIPTGVHFEVASVYENAVVAVGQNLSGVGEITQINGVATASLCSSACELTYRFTNYLVSSITGTQATFTGGMLTVYLAFGANNDFNPFASGGSAADLAAATNGTNFLDLSGHVIDAGGHTLVANVTTGDLLGANFTFFGTGLLDVAAGPGVANNNFNTNSVPAAFGGPADISLSSSGQNLVVPHPSECPGGTECVSGSSDLRGLVVPEPGSLALLAAGLLAFGIGSNRRRRG